MKVLTPGHRYELESFEGSAPQVIQFIEKRRKEEGSPELVTVNDGTTNEEVLKVLIDRMEGMNAKLPNDFTRLAITNLKLALAQLEARTAERKARQVEGTMAS